MRSAFIGFVSGSLLMVPYAWAEPASSLTLEVAGIRQNAPIEERFAYCAPAPKIAENISPALAWDNAPDGTKSFAVVMVDPDVPADLSDAGKEGKVIAENAPRQSFYHWVLVDIPATTHEIPENAGKGFRSETNALDYFGVPGVNHYLKFKGEEATPANIKKYTGYDGNCPPANDERLHHYHFQVYALDVPTLGLKQGFTPEEATPLIESHKLAMVEVVGTYTQNPKLR